MDILTFERIWEDVDFFEIEVVAQTEKIRAIARIYTTESSINELSLRLAKFPKNPDDRYIWKNGEKGDGSTPFVSLEFWCLDESGHIILEVYMEIDDGASLAKHNCCFYLKTEIGLLNNFGQSLILLNDVGIGTKITLNK